MTILGIIVFLLQAWENIPFPDAYGFGATENYGGSGRHESTPSPIDYHVTSLLDNGQTGTLRYGLEVLTGPRMIYFDKAGQIELQSPIRITDPYVTIAGETAPGRVVVMYYFISIETHDVAIRFITCRLGDGALDFYGTEDTDFDGTTTATLANTSELAVDYELGLNEALTNAKRIDAIQGPTKITLNNDEGVGTGTDIPTRYIYFSEAKASEMRSISQHDASNVILDHVSASWGIDAIIEHGNGGDSTTYQFCFFGEALDNSYHTDGPHSKGLTISSSLDNAAGFSLIGTLLTHCAGRNPRLSAVAGRNEILNSVVYNVSDESGAGIHVNGNNAQTRLLSNYLKRGPDSGTTHKMLSHNPLATLSSTYVSHNIGPGRPSDTGDEWLITDDDELFQEDTDFDFEQEDPYTPITDPTAALKSVLRFSGDRPQARDAVDARYAEDVLDGTGEIIDSQGTYPAYPELTRTFVLVSNPNNLHHAGWTKRDWQLHLLAKELIEGVQKIQIF